MSDFQSASPPPVEDAELERPKGYAHRPTRISETDIMAQMDVERRLLREILDSIMVLFTMVEAGRSITQADIAHTKRLIGQLGDCHAL